MLINVERFWFLISVQQGMRANDESKWRAYFVTMKSNDDKRGINKEESRKLLVLFKNPFAYLQYNTDDEDRDKILIFSNKNKSLKKFSNCRITNVYW